MGSAMLVASKMRSHFARRSLGQCHPKIPMLLDRRRLILVISGLVILSRETGLLNISAYSAEADTTHTDNCQLALPPINLTAEERSDIHSWKETPVRDHPELRLYVRTSVDLPLTRWIPLFKFGAVHTDRDFMVLRNGRKLAGGRYRSNTEQTVYGFMSAYEYRRQAIKANDEAFQQNLIDQLKQNATMASR